MYECPDGCGSTTFQQQVLQRETVETDGSGGVVHIDVNGDPITMRVTCCKCGALVHTEAQNVYAVVVHPPDTTSDVINVYAGREKADQVADELRSEEQGIEAAVKQYEVVR